MTSLCHTHLRSLMESLAAVPGGEYGCLVGCVEIRRYNGDCVNSDTRVPVENWTGTRVGF